MDRNVSPNLLFKSITYVEAEAVEVSRFRFHRKRTASTASTSLPKTLNLKIKPQPKTLNQSCCHKVKVTYLD